jgi:Fe2+ transport system protein FeoA
MLERIGGSGSVQKRLLQYGLSRGAPISRYATAPLGRGGVWRQGSLLIALRETDATHLLCRWEVDADE